MIEIVSMATGVPVADIMSKSRKQHINEARQLYWKRLYECGFTYVEIGRISGRNHSTIYHGIRHVSDLLESGDKVLNKMWEDIETNRLKMLGRKR